MWSYEYLKCVIDNCKKASVWGSVLAVILVACFLYLEVQMLKKKELLNITCPMISDVETALQALAAGNYGLDDDNDGKPCELQFYNHSRGIAR